eukprot:scaffold80712_cov66-Phaeocystis_antarctica.AAC.1
MPFIACAIGINCARSCSVLCPMIDTRSPRTQPAPIVTGSLVNVEFSRLCLDKVELRCTVSPAKPNQPRLSQKPGNLFDPCLHA